MFDITLTLLALILYIGMLSLLISRGNERHLWDSSWGVFLGLFITAIIGYLLMTLVIITQQY